MKLVSCILMVATVMLGMGRFNVGTTLVPDKAEHARSLDCCGDDETFATEKDAAGLEDACRNGCDCSCCYHIMALSYEFVTIPGTTVRPFDYGVYLNDYHFEFHTLLFEPPRFG